MGLGGGFQKAYMVLKAPGLKEEILHMQFHIKSIIAQIYVQKQDLYNNFFL